MGYDFSVFPQARFTLQNFDLPMIGDLITEVGDVSDDNNVYIDQIKNFKEVFAKILATQDKDYFTSSLSDTKKMIKTFYADVNQSINLEQIDKNKFYESVENTINNLKINYFKLSYFRLDQVVNKKEWSPNIAKWTYGDADITLQYRRKETNVLLRNLSELVKSSNNEIIINTISINGSQIAPLYFKIDKPNHSITSYHMSKDGYLYVLKMNAGSKRVLITTMHDFMKIAMGIYFDDKSTDKWYIQQQNEIKKYYSLILEEKLMKNLPELDEDWADQIVDFKSNNSEYPNENLYENLKKEKEQKSMRNKVKNYFYKITD
jgi:sulfur relay (sulfurtransferase) DsrC/TusE family protein